MVLGTTSSEESGEDETTLDGLKTKASRYFKERNEFAIESTRAAISQASFQRENSRLSTLVDHRRDRITILEAMLEETEQALRDTRERNRFLEKHFKGQSPILKTHGTVAIALNHLLDTDNPTFSTEQKFAKLKVLLQRALDVADLPWWLHNAATQWALKWEQTGNRPPTPEVTWEEPPETLPETQPIDDFDM